MQLRPLNFPRISGEVADPRSEDLESITNQVNKTLQIVLFWVMQVLRRNLILLLFLGMEVVEDFNIKGPTTGGAQDGV